MFFLLLFSILVSSSIRPFIKSDIHPGIPGAQSPTLVFLYYERVNFKCPLCALFKDGLGRLTIPVLTLNFAENPVLGSRFLQYSFPAFIVRSEGRSYVINPQSVEELGEILKGEKWRETEPVKAIVDVDSVFATVFSYANGVIYRGVMIFRWMLEYVPEYVVNLFILGIIGLLIYSIVDVLRQGEDKEKIE